MKLMKNIVKDNLLDSQSDVNYELLLEHTLI